MAQSLTLGSSVWFDNGPTLTIAQNMALSGTGDPRFYGTYYESGGQNPATPAATIQLLPGAKLSASFLSAAEEGGFIAAEGTGTRTIINRGNGSGIQAVKYLEGGSLEGYLNWK